MIDMEDMHKILDKHLTDEEFDAGIQKSRTLHLCKEKGFPNLLASGAIKMPPKKTKQRIRTQEELDQIKDTINTIISRIEKGQKLNMLLKEFDMSAHQYTYWRNKYGLSASRGKLESVDLAISLVNEHGFSLSSVADQMKITRYFLKKQLKQHGYKYNSRKKKIINTK